MCPKKQGPEEGVRGGAGYRQAGGSVRGRQNIGRRDAFEHSTTALFRIKTNPSEGFSALSLRAAERPARPARYRRYASSQRGLALVENAADYSRWKLRDKDQATTDQQSASGRGG